MTNVVAPRPVFCVVEHAYRDRAIAERVCRGQFQHQGVTLDLGVEPDWLGAALPSDREWRLEWVKFYYSLDLAWAFRETGEPRFQETWERLVRSWIRQVPISTDPSDVIGRRIQNWIYAWNGFAAGDRFERLSDGTADLVLESLGAQIAHLRAHLTRERNHRTLELYALFIAALALPVLDPGGGLLAFAVEELQRNLLQDVGPDGVHRERSTHYHHVVLRSFLGARENARRFGLRFPPEFDERLARACDFSRHVHRPDGTIPALSDSDSGSYLDLLALAGDLGSSSEPLRGASPSERVTTPGSGRLTTSGSERLRTSASFPVGGYFVQRSGRDHEFASSDGERFLLFDCGPVGDGGHGHYDALSIDVAAGRPLVVDPGRFTYCDDPPHWRRWFKSTAAHNTVTVDGLDQTPYRRGKPKGPVAQARLLHRLAARGVDGRDVLDILYGEVRSPAYEAIHRRRIVFVNREYWIVHDSLVGSRPHRYDLRFHLAPSGARDQCAVTVDCDDLCAVRASGLGLVAASAGAPPWPIAIEDGWVSTRYGVKEPAQVVVSTADDVECAEFFTLLMPLPDAAPMPVLAVHRHTVEREEVLVADIWMAAASGMRRDCVMWTASGHAAALPGIGTAEAAAVVDSRNAGDAGAHVIVPEIVDVHADLGHHRIAIRGVAV
jgi:hypothetical protein